MNYGYDENGNPVVYASQIPQNMGQYGAVNRTNAMCLVGFILSFFTLLLGLIFSIIGLVQVRKSREKGSGFAIAGIIISGIRLMLIIGLFLLIIFAINFEDEYYYDDYYEPACQRAVCDHYCVDGDTCKCYYEDADGDRETIYCKVDWSINEKDYSSLA